MPTSLLVWSLQTSAVAPTEQVQIPSVRGPGRILDARILGPTNLGPAHSAGLKITDDIGDVGVFLGIIDDIWDLVFNTPILRSPLIGFSPWVMPFCHPYSASRARMELTLESGPPDPQPLSYAVHIWQP